MLARKDFVGVIRNLMSGHGFAPDAAMVVFPIESFLPGSDLEPIRLRKQEFYDGLTRWAPPASGDSGIGSRIITVEHPPEQDAAVAANRSYAQRRWGDGLPLVPATRERVAWILRGAALPRTHVIGRFPPRGGVATVEGCAIALAMAGGRPEYLPVLVAAVEAFLDPHSDADALQADSGSVYPAIIVNGPVARRIRLNSGFSCLGPDPAHPAGASIGRALRLMQQNVGGAVPGSGAMAMYGAMRYTNAVFAEDEEGLPAGWIPHGSERHGFTADTNSLSLVFVNGVVNIKRRSAIKETPEEDVLQGMHRIADVLAGAQLGVLPGYREGAPGILMIPRVVAQMMASLGWTKASMREFLWEHSRVPMDRLQRSGARAWIEIQAPESLTFDPWPITAKADNFVVVVAGGGHPTNAYWLPGCCPQVIGREIRLPESFDVLLAEAAAELDAQPQ
jgi:hypothetical protein